MNEWTAVKLLEVTGAYWQGCAIMAAVELDLFNLLNNAPDNVAGLARRVDADPRALGMLLRALAALQLLDQQGDRYVCTPAAESLLVAESPENLANIVSHQHHLLESWGRLHVAVRSGKPVRQRSSFAEETWRESFLLGMQNLANLIAPQLVPLIDIGSRLRMLDLGGGPGTWALHFCRHNPDLQAQIVDLPTSREFAERAIKKAGMTSRITFHGADFNHDQLPGDQDLVWMSHILHGEGPANCRALVAKAAATLKADGLLVIHEFILDDKGPGPLYPALFALNMLLGTEDGAAYREAELRDWLSSAGLGKVTRLELPPQSRSGVLIARSADAA